MIRYSSVCPEYEGWHTHTGLHLDYERAATVAFATPESVGACVWAIQRLLSIVLLVPSCRVGWGYEIKLL